MAKEIPKLRQKHQVSIDGRLKWNVTEKLSFLFLFGGAGYGLIELIWRGHTHPSMVVTGGICFVILYSVNSLKTVPSFYAAQYPALPSRRLNLWWV